MVHAAGAADATWWRHAVIYQIYPRSWADGNGDGMGDLPGVTARLQYLRDLGVDAVWFSPLCTSPQVDAGYDVADYRDIDPRFGTLADADRMLATAHDLGLKVIVDLVPNHSSDEHAWFRAALAAGPGSRERARYLFRDGRGRNGDEPPNNWNSVFGGVGWTRVSEADGEPGQWYLHLFDTRQPDFNWANPEVRAEFESVLRFWLDRGVDGFRVDVAHGLVKQAGLPDWDGEQRVLGGLSGAIHVDEPDRPDARAGPPDARAHAPDARAVAPDGLDAPAVLDGADALDARADETGDNPRPPMWDQEGVHEIYQGWRAVLDSYGVPERILCAEAWVEPATRAARYVRGDEMHQAFNFDFLECPWRADSLRRVVGSSLAAADSVGAPSTWVLSNHDVVRHASALGLPQGPRRPRGIGRHDRRPDRELGLRRARAATTLMLALPGAAYLYQGEELGLPDATDIPDRSRQDPAFSRSGGAEVGRDGCRVPMPWESDRPSFGFGPSERSWLPQPAIYGEYAVDRQSGVPGSTLELYRALLALRRAERLGDGSLRWLEDRSGVARDVVAFVNERPGGNRLLVLANLGNEPVALPDGASVVVASADLDPQGLVPTDTAVWACW